ncbi:MAG TPA: TolC family protein [Methylophilaceae bacterium]|nr:TolC family protein [Methylophilaceae bacterium]
MPYLLAVLLLLAAQVACAGNSIWYRDDDPLKTESLTPPQVPQAYVDDHAAPCAPPQLTQPLTLADVANTALCNNPQTRETWANARIEAAQVGIAKSAYLPQVSDTVSADLNWNSPELASRSNPYNTLGNNIVASYLLYDFGGRDANLESARQLLLAASASQDTVIQNILLTAVQAYYQVQANQAAVAAARETERAAEESFKAADARYRAGVATPADKLQAQTTLAQATLTRISAEGNLKTAYGVLANIMGLPANQTLALAPANEVPSNPDIGQDINALIEQARARRPDLVASEAQVKAAEADIEVTKAAAKPSISVFMGHNFQDGSNLTSNNNSSVGINVQIPLFEGYAPSYRIRSAQAVADLRAAQRDTLRLQISLDVWRAYHSLRTASESISAARVLLNSAEESARVALGRYKAGVGNILDVLYAQSALANARQQFIQASLNWNIARAVLAQSIGGLDNAMIQSLPVSTAATVPATKEQ